MDASGCIGFACLALSLLVHSRTADGIEALAFLFCVGKTSQSLCLPLLACLCSPLLACLCLPLLACLLLLACLCLPLLVRISPDRPDMRADVELELTWPSALVKKCIRSMRAW